MASDYFDSSIEFPELDILTGLPVGAKESTSNAGSSLFSNEDWQKQLMEDGTKALDSGAFVNPMDIATQEENKKLRKQLEDLREDYDRAQTEFREQQDKYVEVLRQLNDKNQAALEEQKVQHEKQMSELTSHFEALQTASRNAGEKESEMRVQLDEIRAERDLIQKKTEELQRELEDQRRLTETERQKASEEKDRILAESKEINEKMAMDASAKEEELRNIFGAEKQELLDEIERIKARAAEDSESQKTYYENKLQEELGLKDAELASRLAEADENQKRLLEKADQDQAALKENVALQINEMLVEKQKLQDKSVELARNLEESNKNYEQISAELMESRKKLEYAESEQAKREIEASRKKLEEEASLRDQKIAEAKQIIQKQWSKIQDDRALIEAEKEVLFKERADAEEEKNRAISWQQATLTERLRLQDAQKKLAADQEEMDLLRADLENLRTAMNDEQSRFVEEKNAYEKRVEEETAERQRQIAAARAFLEKQHKESEEERANVMMERLTFEKERDDANKQLESERNEFEERKRRFREELDRLTNWEGFKTDSFEIETEQVEKPEESEAEEMANPSAEESAEYQVEQSEQDTTDEETTFSSDFFQDDPVESVFSDEPMPSQDRIISESSDTDEKSVMASPFADLFTEPSLTESLFANLLRSDNSEYSYFEETSEAEDYETDEVELSKVSADMSQDEELTEPGIQEELSEKENEEEYPDNKDENPVKKDLEEEETEHPAEEEVYEAENVQNELEEKPAEVQEEPSEQCAPKENDASTETETVLEVVEAEKDSDVEETVSEDLTATLAIEIEQKVSELMDTVSQSEMTEPVLKELTKENLFDTLADVGLTAGISNLETGEIGKDLSFSFDVPEEKNSEESEVVVPEFSPIEIPEDETDKIPDDEPFDFDAVTDALNVAMLEKEDFSFTENNTMPEGDSFLITEGVTSKYYVNTSSYSYPAFREVSFICPANSCTAILSDVPFCSYALLRALASPDELAEGEVYVGGHKISAADYLYIGSDRLLSRHSNVLEWLVDNAGGKTGDTEKRYKELLEKVGITKWAKQSLGSLSYSRRILVLLVSSAEYNADLIFINDPHFTINPKDEMVARRIFKHLNDSGKTVVISTPDLVSVQSVASRVVLLKNSAVLFSDSYKQFMEQYSTISVSIPREYEEEVKRVIGSDSTYSVLQLEDECVIKLQKGSLGSTGDLIRIAEEAGVPTEQIRNSEKTFADACGEAFTS